MEAGHIECATSFTGQIERLLSDKNIVLSFSEPFSIIDVNSGCAVVTEEPCGDRFKLLISYGGNRLTWEVLFNTNCSHLPPDFIFHDPGFEPNIDNIKGLETWSTDDSGSLSVVVRQLLEEYRRYQVEQLSGTRVQFEYDSLVCGLSGPEDLEVYMSRTPSAAYNHSNGPPPYNGYPAGSVTFLMRLNVDFSRLPEYLREEYNVEDSRVLLTLNYQSVEGGRVSPMLLLSPNIQRLFQQAGEFRLRSFEPDSSAGDYVPTVLDQLNDTISLINASFERRRDYVNAFVSTFERNVLEYDVTSYHRINLLFNFRDFHFVFNIILTMRFPSEQPVFRFQSIYHVDNSALPYSKVMRNYPYSPRWAPAEMVERARDIIVKTVGDFQRESVSNGQKWEL